MGYGFIREEQDIKYLVLFALRFFPFAIPEADLLDVVLIDDAFGYFEFSQAFSDLLEQKFVSSVDSQGETYYLLTPAGEEIIAVMADSLPLSVRDKAEKAALRVIAKTRRDASIRADHTENADGSYTVTLKVCDGAAEQFSLSLMVYTARQCTLIESNFREHAEQIYSQILSSISMPPKTNAD